MNSLTACYISFFSAKTSLINFKECKNTKVFIFIVVLCLFGKEVFLIPTLTSKPVWKIAFIFYTRDNDSNEKLLYVQ